MVISGCDGGFRVGSRCQSEDSEKCGLILGLANRVGDQLRIRWDSSDPCESDQAPSPEANLKSLKSISERPFNLEKFGKVDESVIVNLSRLIDLDPGQIKTSDAASVMSTRLNSPGNSPRVTPRTSTQTLDTLRDISSDKPLARIFAGHMVQSAAMRVIMLLFSSSSVGDITQTDSHRQILSSLVQQAVRPSSLEVGVPLSDLIRSSNVMLASAMGAASPWESKSSLFDDAELVATSDEELEDDEELMSTSSDEDETAEVVVTSRTTGTQQNVQQNHPPSSIGQIETGPIETVLMEHQRRIQQRESNSPSQVWARYLLFNPHAVGVLSFFCHIIV